MTDTTEADYTGDVVPGGPPDTRVLPSLSITKVAVDEKMANNAYLLCCRTTGQQLLVDAADDPELLLDLIGDRGLEAVVTTHQHWDHHRALERVVAATRCDVVAGAPDAEAVTEQTGVPVTRTVTDGDTIEVGACTLEVIRITGHTPGSICLLYDDRPAGGVPHLFTGDSLFPGGVGATFGDDDAFASLIEDVEHKIFGRLPDQTWFYPGHGKDSTLGAERPHLAEWRERGW